MTTYLSKRMKIIDSIVVLIIFGFWLYSLIHRPYMRIIVRYNDVPAINNNLWLYKIHAHYRGYEVGDVAKIKLSKDQNYIEFYVNIYYKDLKLPKNVVIIFKTENLYGSRYLDIEPSSIPTKEILSDGDTVMGVTAYERFDEYLLQEVKSTRSQHLLKNLSEITSKINESLKNKNNEKLLNQSSGDLAIILENLKDIAEDPIVKTDIKSTIKLSSSSLKNVNEILSDQDIKNAINNAPESINMANTNIKSMNENLSKVSGSIPEVTKNLAMTNNLLTDTNYDLCSINNKVPPIPPSFIENAEKLVVKTDCFESEISKILTKRWLILKLIFGKPGKSFKNCVKKECNCTDD